MQMEITRYHVCWQPVATELQPSDQSIYNWFVFADWKSLYQAASDCKSAATKGTSAATGMHYLLTIHLPALVLPSRMRTPFFCITARSRWTVRGSTDNTCDICLLEAKGLFSIILHIFSCLSVRWTCDKLTTPLTTLPSPSTRHGL